MSQNAGPDYQERLKIDCTLAYQIEEWNGLCDVSTYCLGNTYINIDEIFFVILFYF